MPFVDPTARRQASPLLVTLVALLGTGCSHAPEPVAPTAAPLPAAGSTDPSTRLAAKPVPSIAPGRRPWRPSQHWDDYRVQAAERIVEANPEGTYGGPVSEPLLAIPVLEIELNGDGSVRRIVVMRKPTQALDTVQLAIAAVQRAAPFGAVDHLPRPWRFTEVFLFDDQRRFKPRSLDL